MAHTNPTTITKSYFRNQNGRTNEGEWGVFQRLKAVLSNRYWLLPRVEWVAERSDKSVESRGEIDFVIIDLKRGVLALEVKSGLEWSDEDGWVDKAKPDEDSDPRRQLERNKKWLDTKIGRALGVVYETGYALCLPKNTDAVDPAFGQRRLLPQSVLLDDDRLCKWIDSAFESWGLNTALTDEQANKVITTLRPRSGETCEWRLEQSQVLHEIREATEEQQKALAAILQAERRIAVSGCAGSGKTVLALESARRFAVNGMRVLLLCYNDQLRRKLQIQHKSLDNVVINNFFGYATQILREASRLARLNGEDGFPNPVDYFETQGEIDLLFDAASMISPEFDVVLIDEGQDSHPDWIDIAISRLKDERQNRVVLFYDEFQRLYDRGNPKEVVRTHNLETIPLTINCRNPRPIHEAAMRFHPRGMLFVARVGEGPKPRLLPVKRSTNLRLEQATELTAWLSEMKPKASEVVVLVPHSAERLQQVWPEGSHIGEFEVVHDVIQWMDSKNKTKILASTVHKFKGLEAPFVVMSDLEGISEDRRAPVLYTALSRASYQLVYLLAEGLKL